MTENRRRRQRKSLINMIGKPICFYCDLGFSREFFSKAPEKGQPGFKKYRRYTMMTLEHLVAKANGGSKGIMNCVLAHQICNNIADRKSFEDKIALAGRISGIPKWIEAMGRYIGEPYE